MNGNVVPSGGGGILLKQEREVPVKNEIVALSVVGNSESTNTGSSNNVCENVSTLNQNLIGELNANVESLNEEKSRIIQQLITVQSENQRLLLNQKKRESAIDLLHSEKLRKTRNRSAV